MRHPLKISLSFSLSSSNKRCKKKREEKRERTSPWKAGKVSARQFLICSINSTRNYFLLLRSNEGTVKGIDVTRRERKGRRCCTCLFFLPSPLVVKKKRERERKKEGEGEKKKEFAFFGPVAVALPFDFSNYEFERSIGTRSRKESQRTCQKLRNPLFMLSPSLSFSFHPLPHI